MFYRILLGALLSLMLIGAAAAQDGTASKVKVEKSGEITLLAGKSADLKADLDSDGFKLPNDIGKRIDTARESGNPADLWPVALSLALAEQASGKQSALINSMQLTEEATEKARRNKDASNLLMAAHAYKSAGDTDMYNALLAESQAAASSTEGEKAGPTTFDLEVNNYWVEPADVYLGDYFIGTVYPGYYIYWNDFAAGYYSLYAYGVHTGGYTVVDIDGAPYGVVSVDLI